MICRTGRLFHWMFPVGSLRARWSGARVGSLLLYEPPCHLADHPAPSVAVAVGHLVQGPDYGHAQTWREVRGPAVYGAKIICGAVPGPSDGAEH